MEPDHYQTAPRRPAEHDAPNLFDPPAVDPVAHARRTDPQTSHDAAASVTDLTAKQRAVLDLLATHGPYTDWQLVLAYYDRIHPDTKGLPMQSESGIRTRRSELVARGLVHDTGERLPLPTGRMATVWGVADRAHG